MAGTGNVTQGRLAGAKARSYLRAVNEPEARASQFTARIMLITDLAYLLCSAELKLMPRDHAQHLLAAVLGLIDELPNCDLSRPPGDIVSQREQWISERVSKKDAAWLHLGRNRGESLRSYIPRLFFRQVLHDQGRQIASLVRRLVECAEPLLGALAPNYHHLQHSGLATVGEYLLSWAVTFERHVQRLKQIDQRLDRGPSTFGGRQQTNQLFDAVSARLGFTSRARLRRDGSGSRPVQRAVLCPRAGRRRPGPPGAGLRIWVTPEFALFDLADAHASGSSGLPHAKVPFGLQEVIGSGVMASTRLAGEMAASCAGPSEGSEPLYSSSTLYQMALDIVANTTYMAEVIDQGTFRTDEMKRKALLDYAGTSEAHERPVYAFGVPFASVTAFRYDGARAFQQRAGAHLKASCAPRPEVISMSIRTRSWTLCSGGPCGRPQSTKRNSARCGTSLMAKPVLQSWPSRMKEPYIAPSMACYGMPKASAPRQQDKNNKSET